MNKCQPKKALPAFPFTYYRKKAIHNYLIVLTLDIQTVKIENFLNFLLPVIVNRDITVLYYVYKQILIINVYTMNFNQNFNLT